MPIYLPTLTPFDNPVPASLFSCCGFLEQIIENTLICKILYFYSTVGQPVRGIVMGGCNIVMLQILRNYCFTTGKLTYINLGAGECNGRGGEWGRA